MQQYFAYQLKS